MYTRQIQRWKVEWRSSGIDGEHNVELLLNDYRISTWGDEMFWK